MICDDDCCGATAVYLQPQKRSKILFRPPCKPVTTQIDTNTIYKKSYYKVDPVPRELHRPVRKILQFGELDMNTVYNMTYKWTPVERAQAYRPKPRLKISTDPMEMISNHMSSYQHPGVVKQRFTCKKNVHENCKVKIPMVNITTTKQAYSIIDNEKLSKPVKNITPSSKCKWPSNFKPNYQTNYRADYQYYLTKPTKNYRPIHKKCPVSSKFESMTIYRASYLPPGSFMKIN